MLENTITPIASAISLHDGKPKTNSLAIAKHFGKNHYDVLRDIRQLTTIENGLSAEFVARNFAGNNYQIEGTKSSKRTAEMLDLTFDGFVLLVMSYRGEKAMRIKEAYINEFNRMKAELEAIKDAALQTVQDKLFARFEHWPAARVALQQTNTSAAQIDRELGWPTGRTARAKKSMAGWGLISQQAKAAMDHEHRRHAAKVAAITRKSQMGFNFGAFEGAKA